MCICPQHYRYFLCLISLGIYLYTWNHTRYLGHKNTVRKLGLSIGQCNMLIINAKVVPWIRFNKPEK